MPSNTPNKGLYKPDSGEDGVADELNANWDVIDTDLRGFLNNGTEIDLERVSSSDVNNVKWASTPDEINGKITDLTTGGYIRLKPGDYTEADWTGQITVPGDGNSYTIDMRGATMDMAASVNTTGPWIKIDPDTNPRQINLVGGTVDAVDCPEADLKTFVEEWDTTKSDIKIDIKGKFDIGYEARRQGGSGHQNRYHLNVNGAYQSVKIGDSADTLGPDRCKWMGQLMNIGDTAVTIIHGGWNDLFFQFEHAGWMHSPTNGDIRGYYADAQKAGDNTIHIPHRMTNMRDGISFDVRHPRINFDLVGLGANAALEKCAISTAPSNISCPEYHTESFKLGNTNAHTLFNQVTSAGTIDHNNFGSLKLTPDAAAGNVVALETPSRVAIADRALSMYLRFAGLPTTSAKTRFGLYNDESNYAMLVSDPANQTNWKIEAVVGGTTQVDYVTSKPLNSELTDLTIFSGANDDRTQSRQFWHINHDRVGESVTYNDYPRQYTTIDVGSLTNPARTRVDVSQTAANSEFLAADILEYGYLQDNRA